MVSIPLYLSVENDCEYLSGNKSRLIFVAQDFPMTSEIYSQLASKGFRRSGEMVYGPKCDHCSACVPVRIPVREFSPTRSQRRALTKNSDLSVSHQPMKFNGECFELYTRYLETRHRDGSMAGSTPDDFLQFLSSPWSSTKIIEFRLSNKLVCVAVVDYMDNSLSAVYSFFDPEYTDRSLGIFSILWQIQAAKELGLNWVYLGFWIQKCQKMAYKNLFRPIEAYNNGTWQIFQKDDVMS